MGVHRLGADCFFDVEDALDVDVHVELEERVAHFEIVVELEPPESFPSFS